MNSIESDFELGQNLYTNANVQVHTHAFAFELDNRAICYAPSNRAFGLRYSTSDLDMLDSNSSCTRDGDESAYEEAARGEWSAEEGPLGREGELGEYDREQASHVKRLHEAPQWMWGRANDGKCEVHYWKVKPEDGQRGIPTRIWRFQHRNGEMAFGDDPLEFWEDWEGSMAGDIAEATPYGPAFQDYLSKQKLSPLSENPWDFWPEDRVVKYNEDEAFFCQQ